MPISRKAANVDCITHALAGRNRNSTGTPVPVAQDRRDEMVTFQKVSTRNTDGVAFSGFEHVNGKRRT